MRTIIWFLYFWLYLILVLPEYWRVCRMGKQGKTEQHNRLVRTHVNNWAGRLLRLAGADITTTGIYHIADFNAGGKGYFACGGKLIPIVWMCGGDKEPFRFFTESGEPLELGRGNTYMAICTPQSPVVCEGMPEQPAETTAAS